MGALIRFGEQITFMIYTEFSDVTYSQSLVDTDVYIIIRFYLHFIWFGDNGYIYVWMFRTLTPNGLLCFPGVHTRTQLLVTFCSHLPIVDRPAQFTLYHRFRNWFGIVMLWNKFTFFYVILIKTIVSSQFHENKNHNRILSSPFITAYSNLVKGKSMSSNGRMP